MKPLYPLIFCFFLSISLIGQDNYSAHNKEELDSLFQLKYSTGEYQQCIAILEEGQRRTSSKGMISDSTGYAKIAALLGYVYWNLGDYRKSKEVYHEAEKIQLKLYGKNHIIYIKTISNIAVMYQEMGDYEEAEQLYLLTKDFLAKKYGETHLYYASSLNNLATLYQDMGDYEQAEPLLIQAKNIREQNQKTNLDSYIRSVNNLAYLYKEMGSYAKAKSLFELSKSLCPKSNSDKTQKYLAVSINNLAELYHKQKMYAKAEAMYLEAWDIRLQELGKMHPNSAISLKNLASLYLEIGQFEKAEAYFLEAKNIRAKIFGTKHPVYAESLKDLANLYNQMANFDTAITYALNSISANCPELDSSLSIAHLLDNSKNIVEYKYYSGQQAIESFAVLLDILDKQYKESSVHVNLEEYFYLSKLAMDLNEQFRIELTGDKDKLRTLNNNTRFIKHGIETAINLNKPAYLKEAFVFAELNKSVLLTDAIRGNRARSIGDLPEELISKELALQKQLSKLKKEQLEAATTPVKNELNNKIGSLQIELNGFLKSIKDKYPKYHALKYENIIAQPDEIQGLLKAYKGGDALLLEYFQTEEVLYLFALSKDDIELFPIQITRTELGEKITAFRKSLSSYKFIMNDEKQAYQLYVETAHWFYQNILAIALKDKKQKNLIVITDGELGHLPFETFLTKKADIQNLNYKNLPYLMKDYAINYNYSTTLWKENQSTKKQDNNHSILACAADYNQHDTLFLKSRLPKVARLRQSLKPLKAAQNEVSTIAEAFAGAFLFETAANERDFKAKAQEYGVVHLAMHGVLNKKYPMLSSLAFTEDKDSLEDNFLQAYEISRLHLNADLVVLSACETGYGKFEQGEGVISLARSFMYAGTPSLVVSLWAVNDFSTSFVMKMFYEQLANGIAKDEALNIAKLAYLNQVEGIAGHPAYWSPFIQIGDASPLSLKAKNTFSNWAWGSLLFLLILVAAGAFFFLKKKK